MVPHLNICTETPHIGAAILRKMADRRGDLLLVERGSIGFLFIACGSLGDAEALKENWAHTGSLPYGTAWIEGMLGGKLLIVRQYGVESQRRLAGLLKPFIDELRTLTTVQLIDDDTGTDVSNASYSVLFGDVDIEGG